MPMKQDKNTVVFGCKGLAEVMAAHLKLHGKPVAAFTLEQDLLELRTFESLPVVAWESLPQAYPPDKFDLLIPLGWSGVNAVRERIYRQAQALGYRLPGFQSPSAELLAEVHVNSNTIIYGQSLVGLKTQVGENVYISSGSNISHHCVVENHVFIASGVLVGGHSHIERNAVIGLGAVVRSGVRIGQGAFVGMGAVVTQDVAPHSVVVGNPGRRVDITPMQAATRKSSPI